MTSIPPSTPRPEGRAARPRLCRSSTDAMLGGVGSGLAEYSGIDAVLWRVGFVVLTCAGGSGVLAYLLLWVLMPAGPARPDEQPGVLEQFIGRLHTGLSRAGGQPPRG